MTKKPASPQPPKSVPKTIRRVRYTESVEAGDCGRIVPPSSLWINLYRWSYNGGGNRLTGHVVDGPLKDSRKDDYCIRRYDLHCPSPSTSSSRLEKAALECAMRNMAHVDDRVLRRWASRGYIEAPLARLELHRRKNRGGK